MTAFEIFMTLGGVGMIIVLIKFVTDRSLLIDNINYWKKQVDKENNRAEELIKMKDDKLASLYSEVLNLKVQLAEEKLSVEDLPFMYARLDSEARMIDFSNLYSETWLRPNNMNPFTYKGKTSEEYWGEIAHQWTIHDRYCLRNWESFIGKENLEINNHNQLGGYVIYKKPGLDKNNKKILHVFIFDDKKIIEMFNSCERDV